MVKKSMQNKYEEDYCKMCTHLLDVTEMVIDGMCEFCIDDMQDAKDWEDTYNELNRWVG